MARDDTLGVADIGEILRLLPHRYPFLLIDRVINIRGDQHGIGIKNLTMNEPFLARSAKNLVIPGVLVIEGMAQTAALEGPFRGREGVFGRETLFVCTGGRGSGRR
jgi:3-hydroxyacyl-[acyl-carrier-protein] dehydratase